MDPAGSAWRNGAKSHLYPGKMSKCCLKGNFLYCCSEITVGCSNEAINNLFKDGRKQPESFYPHNVEKLTLYTLVWYSYTNTYVCVLIKAPLSEDVVQRKDLMCQGFLLINPCSL